MRDTGQFNNSLQRSDDARVSEPMAGQMFASSNTVTEAIVKAAEALRRELA
jgi:hypothetical protein